MGVGVGMGMGMGMGVTEEVHMYDNDPGAGRGLPVPVVPARGKMTGAITRTMTLAMGYVSRGGEVKGRGAPRFRRRRVKRDQGTASMTTVLAECNCVNSSTMPIPL